MKTYEEAKKIILTKYSDSNIVGAFKLSNGYLFSLKPKDFKDKYVLDGFFKVSNVTGEITEYSPVMNPEEFKNALKNKVE